MNTAKAEALENIGKLHGSTMSSAASTQNNHGSILGAQQKLTLFLPM
jgi:hypothetical protein